jgi:hypothetical protein
MSLSDDAYSHKCLQHARARAIQGQGYRNGQDVKVLGQFRLQIPTLLAIRTYTVLQHHH